MYQLLGHVILDAAHVLLQVDVQILRDMHVGAALVIELFRAVRLDPISHSLSDHRSLRTLLHGGNARELGEQDGEHDIESARN